MIPRRLNPARDGERIAEHRDFVRAHVPELVPIIKEMVEAGCLTGWRDVISVGPSGSRAPGLGPEDCVAPVVYTAEEHARFDKLRNTR